MTKQGEKNASIQIRHGLGSIYVISSNDIFYYGNLQGWIAISAGIFRRDHIRFRVALLFHRVFASTHFLGMEWQRIY